jgi:hypothetical protein
MNWKFVLILTCLAVCLPLLAAPDGGPLELENGVSFRLEERRGWLAGLGGFAVDGYPLSAPDSLVFPLVADEWAEKPQIAAGLKLREARPVDGGWDLHLELYGAGEPADWAAWFARDAEEGAVVRDKFRFPRIRPLAEITRRAHRADYLDARGGELRRMGELVWRIRPHADVIAGWPWKGWQWRFDLELDAPHQATALRLLGGWEAGGTLQGLTLANQRYRGLGDLEQAIATDADGRATTSFNTQDIPLDAQTAAASAQLDREAALALREESWIHVMARGAGTGYFDFQYNSRAALLAHPQRQGNLRALTEVYPGDGGVGQLSEAHFARARRWSGEAMHYAALVMAAPRSAEFWRTRHLEIDRELRARVGAELGFQADLAVPTVGYLFDFWGATDRFAPLVARMANYAGRLAALGVERVMVHNPGWINGRAVRRGWDGGDRFAFHGGGVNNVYDWLPLPNVGQPWRDLSRTYDDLGIDYYLWITGMSHRDADFAAYVGRDPANWALNSPGGPPNATYGESMLKHNILSPRFREAFDARLAEVRREYGFQGYWGDSFQNLFMSQLDWAGSAGEPQWRAWWEWLAEQSRGGVGWISESHSFPGLSCSIETGNWDRTPWMMGQAVRWLRGTEQTTRPPREWGRIAFQLMAFQSWLAPEIWPYEVSGEIDPESVIEGFARLAHAYRAALPMMRRPYILPEQAGVLWNAEDFPGEAVLFAFKRLELPDGIRAWPVLDHTGQPAGALFPQQVYRLAGAEMLAAFGIEPPPQPDERTPMPLRERGPNLLADPALTWYQPPGELRAPLWSAGADEDPDGRELPWPGEIGPRILFDPGTRTFLTVDGRVSLAGLHAPEEGVSLIIDTVNDGQPGSLLELAGPLSGPVDVYFKGTLRDGGKVHTHLRARTGLRLSGGGSYALDANLLPWPEDYHRHSQVVSLTGPGTTVHFGGRWPATGELSRPGLVLDDGTRFVIWPQADFPYIKNYGGFTLQLWVTGVGERGGVLELHPDFLADRSRDAVNPFAPRGRDLRLGSLGSIRIGGATLVSHDGRGLPITGRAMGDPADGIQNNGHLVFEARDGNRWEVRTRAQSYRGAVWIDTDTTLFTERDLTHLGVTEPPDWKFHYTAANAFQTRRTRAGKEGLITIRKEGPAALVLAGEQAYVEGSRMVVAGGSLVLATDPAAGGMFPDGGPQPGAFLELLVGPEGRAVFDAPNVSIKSLQVEPGGALEWRHGSRVAAVGPADLRGGRIAAPEAGKPTVLLEAAEIHIGSETSTTCGRLEIRATGDRRQLLFIPDPTRCNPE